MFTMESMQQPSGGVESTHFTSNRDQFAEKELNYIKDFLSWELLATKKCAAMAQASNDPQVREMFMTAGQLHEKHYRTLLQQLN